MSDNEEDDTAEKIALGVSVGVGFLLLTTVFVLTLLLCRKRRKEKKAAKAKQSQQVVITPDGKQIGESHTDNSVTLHTASRKSTKAPTAPPPDMLQAEAGDVDIAQNRFNPSYKSPEPLPDYGAVKDPSTPLLAPLHPYPDHMQRKLPSGPVSPHGTQRSGSGALAVVPFRKSQLPVSNVNYSVDGRLYTGQEDFKGRSDLGWEQLQRHHSHPNMPTPSPYEPYFERMVYETRNIPDDASATRGQRARWSIASRNLPYRNPQLSPVTRSKYSSGRRSEFYRYSSYGNIPRKSVGKYESNWKVHSEGISPRVSSERSSGRSDYYSGYSVAPDQPIYAVVDKSRKQAGNKNSPGRMDDFDIPLQEFSSYRMASDVY